MEQERLDSGVLTQCEEAFDDGDFLRCVELSEQIAPRSTHYESSLLWLLTAHTQMHNDTGAKRAFDLLEESYVGDENSLNSLLNRRVRYHIDQSQLDDVIITSTRGMKLLPRNGNFALSRAGAFFDLERYQEALVDCNTAIRAGEALADADLLWVAHAKRGSAFDLLGQHQLALNDFVKSESLRALCADESSDDSDDDGEFKRPSGTRPDYQDLPRREQVYAHVAQYVKPAWFEAMLTFGITIVPWVALLFVLPYTWCGVFLGGLIRMRLFVIFHDCSHTSFLPTIRANRILGTIIGTMVYTSYKSWSAGHKYHHQHSNNYTYPQEGAQTAPWSVSMWNRATPRQKLTYLFFFGPLTTYTVVPIFSMVVINRFTSTRFENAAISGYVLFLLCLGGWPMLAFDILTMIVTANIGQFLFHVQHTFEGSYKEIEPDWSFFENAMMGSSYFQVPRFLRYFTLSIEYHHVHHLNMRVPCYRLPKCHDEGLQFFKGVPHVGWRELLRTVPFSLYNQSSGAYDSVYQHADSRALLKYVTQHVRTTYFGKKGA